LGNNNNNRRRNNNDDDDSKRVNYNKDESLITDRDVDMDFEI
jgi:hypothetical protein